MASTFCDFDCNNGEFLSATQQKHPNPVKVRRNQSMGGQENAAIFSSSASLFKKKTKKDGESQFNRASIAYRSAFMTFKCG